MPTAGTDHYNERSMTMATMPFGRHAGLDLDALPDGYLSWLAGIELHPPLSDAVRREAQRRRTGIEPAPAMVSFPAMHVKFPREELKLARRLIDAGHRVLARKLDPAAGGDPKLLQRLNALAQTVREQLLEPGVQP
jgi:hypothetical protein